MDNGGDGDLGCENRGGSLLDCSSLGNFTLLPADEVLGMSTGSSEHWNRVHSSFNSGWNPLSFFEQNGTFSDVDGILNMQQSCRWIANSACSDDYAKSPEGEGTVRPALDGNKKRKIAQCEDMKTENDGCKGEEDEEKQKPETKSVSKKCKQIIGREVNDSSSSGDDPKKDYVHVRAKRGQATNSHSLAERVRREKIRERMKFLQDLVPGCDKITGKAVMLDEIINYVLSLQKQVEFLSMKVSTVYPEANVEPEQIRQRDIHYSQGGSASILCDPGTRPYPNVAGVWGNDLRSTSRMDFNHDLAPDNAESNGFLDVRR